MKIIGITGVARSGKDTLADYLVKLHGFIKLSFAAPIRAFVADVTDFPLATMEDGPEKEQPLDWLDGQTPRHLMQTVGTEWGRNMIDRDLWIKVVEQKIREARRECATARRALSSPTSASTTRPTSSMTGRAARSSKWSAAVP